MRRRIFNILAAVSLVLCLATAGLWVRSYRHEDSLGKVSPLTPQGQQMERSFISESGVLVYHRYLVCFKGKGNWASPATGWTVWSTPAIDTTWVMQKASRGGFVFLGFGYGCWRYIHRSGTSSASQDFWNVFLPDWFICLLLAIAPALAGPQAPPDPQRSESPVQDLRL